MRFAVISLLGVGILLLGAEPAVIDPALAQTGGCVQANLRGPYAIYGQGTVFRGNPPEPGLEVDVGILDLDGQGNMTGSVTFSFNGTIFRITLIGTYLVNSNCTISITTQDSLGENLKQEGVVIGRGDEIRVIGTDPGRVIARVAKKLH
jgi:hypothetical protein